MTVEEYEKLKCRETFRFNCVSCGEEVTTKKQGPKKKREIQKKFLCRRCLLKQTCLMKYGVENPFQLEGVKEKIKETNLEKYGVENPMQSEKIKEKAVQTNLERYGSRNVFQSEEIKEKIKNTMTLKYGVEFPLQSNDLKEKTKQTMIERYGVEKPLQSKEIQERMKKTCLERYGVNNYSQTLEFQKRKQTKYEYDGLTFDSSWELKFYQFHKERGDHITLHPCYFEYEFENKIHRYFPDFELNGELIEIKGSHFMKDGKMICPFRNKRYSKERMDAYFQAKYECAIKNNVRFLFEEDLPYIRTLRS